jgi:hypothetical protein
VAFPRAPRRDPQGSAIQTGLGRAPARVGTARSGQPGRGARRSFRCCWKTPPNAESERALAREALEQRREEGRERGREEGLELAYKQQLGRALRDAERAALRERWGWLGAARLADVLLDSTAEALAAWLADPVAR